MTFKPRKYDPDRPDKRTAAQKAAHARNYRIFRLRGLHGFACMLTGTRRERMEKLVDAELKALGAEPESARQAARRARWAAELDETDIPF